MVEELVLKYAQVKQHTLRNKKKTQVEPIKRGVEQKTCLKMSGIPACLLKDYVIIQTIIVLLNVHV